ncbi:hypothetical protein H206_00128 [Candidatus Electrothrix aarhusensis]|uniref:Uncharacterized protein n=1 Tax=Candidatus Electrothrix aarhusensis TaxID=1859131 RepID=A0A444J1N6_9BACT|nr:hypothetical protein H206_00128 [Candidatus Electrothrix aarhusensis]
MSNIDIAYDFYQKHIYDKEKINLLRKYNLKIAGSVPSALWELFGALITGKPGAGSTGADLVGWEVKSAKFGGSFEYQYHLNTGANKLKEDSIVNHLFCSYSETYQDVLVKAMRGSSLKEIYFKVWEPQYTKNYDSKVPSSMRRQRFRKSISHGFVNKNGLLVIEIRGGKIITRKDNVLLELNNENS